MKALQYSALALGVVSALASAESTNDASDIETMVITANRFEQTQASVLAATKVVTREDIEVLQAKSTTDVLKTLPGIEVGQNGGRGQLASIFVRGSNSNHVLVLVDGFRMVTSATGHVDFNQVPISSIERLEYIRGAKASTYGSEAISGVINIITKSSFDDTSKSLELSAGSFNTYSGNGVGNFNVGDKGKLKLVLGAESVGGYNAYPLDTPASLYSPAYNNLSDKHGFDSKVATISYEHLFSNNWNGYVSGNWYENAVEFENFGFGKNTTDLRNRSIQGSLNYVREQFNSSLKLSYANQLNKTYPTAAGKDNFHTLADITQTNAQWHNLSQFSDAFKASFGLDWLKEQIGDDYMSSGATYDVGGRSRNNSGLYASGFYDQDKLSLELSLRSDDNSDYGRTNTWSVGFGYYVHENVQLLGSAGTAFRAPSMSDLYGYGGNTELKPEDSQNLELGLRGTASVLDWRVTAYQNKVDNLVESVCDAFWNCSSQNISGKSTLKGIELEGSFYTGPLFNQVSLEFRDPQDKDGEQLARRAKQVFKLGSEYEIQKWLLGAQIMYQGKRPNSSFDDIILDAYTTVDMTVAYQVNEEFSLRGKVANLFDEDYETANGYPAAERSAYVTAKYEF